MESMDTKHCRRCKEIKPVVEFHKQPQTAQRSGRHAQCKSCRKQTRKKYPEKAKQYNDTHQDMRLGAALAHNFWPTLTWRQAADKYYEMQAEQNNLCAICSLPETAKDRYGKTKRLAVDHCHISGTTRKLLCDRCNRGIGFLKDSPSLCAKASEYLVSHGK